MCQTIKITLKNEVLTHWEKFQDTYEQSTLVNGKHSWTSQSKAIWNCGNVWWIGSLNNIGKAVGAFTTTGMLLGANENGKWESFIKKAWKKLDKNDFNIECIAKKGTNHNN